MNFLVNLLNLDPFTIFKLFFYLFEFLYLGFAFVLFKQQTLMAQTVESPQSTVLRSIVLANFLASLILVIFSVPILFI